MSLMETMSNQLTGHPLRSALGAKLIGMASGNGVSESATEEPVNSNSMCSSFPHNLFRVTSQLRPPMVEDKRGYSARRTLLIEGFQSGNESQIPLCERRIA
jgi:hypothetical protein